MPCVIRKQDEVYAEIAPDEWRLQPQVEALEAWVRTHLHDLDRSAIWSADVGFGHRPEATGGGPRLSREMMRLCLEANLEIYLSEYEVRATPKSING